MALFPRSVLFLSLAAVLSGFSSPSPAGDEAARSDPKISGTFSLQLENDYFADTDRHYTNGLRAAWMSEPRNIDYWAGKVGWIPSFPALKDDSKTRTGRLSIAVGQNMYTPGDISATELLVNDRPYAGWLYLGTGFTLETTKKGEANAEAEWQRLDRVELSLGVVGPYSFAEDIQKWWHHVINAPQPMGWQHQVKTEPAIMLSYDGEFKKGWNLSDSLITPVFMDRPRVDVIPNWGGSIGNVFTYGAAGVTFRFGDGLDMDYGPPRIRPSLPGSNFVEAPAKGEDPFRWYLFAGFEGRAVLYNIFLDGNTIAESHDVERKVFVGDFHAGLVTSFQIYGRPVRLAYTQIFRTREFDGQGDPDRFGIVSLSTRF
ncbi:MAG: lipid A deacylase LpxR family protein [Rhodospirillales bacterium]|nr:lipid A deacylase LpxR family protein [Rhodospirillales bacterium]MCW8863132.1 lipid A deacylase LpxR family protein [Rhodospirillales bacterium]MCW9002315.1 lipid A deacylase LpxR family protein [Rhodospirillales bacterium]